MPFINLMVTNSISEDEEYALKTKLGLAIGLIGKSEDYLMLRFQDNCRMWFGGLNYDDLAYVEVSLLSKIPLVRGMKGNDYENLTAEICNILEEVLSISADKVYVKYQETPYWGWNCRMF